MENEKKCPVYKKCSGCQLMNMPYEEQLKFKQIKVERLMGKLCRPERIIGMEDPYNYRCKVQAVFDFRNGKAVSGIYQSAKGSVVAEDSCLINNKRANEIAAAVRKLAVSMKIPVFSTGGGKGFLRYVMIRVAQGTGEIMCAIVGTSDNFPSKNAFAKALSEKCPDITTAVFGVSRSDKIMPAPQYEVLFGRGYIEDIICGRRFRISPGSFCQVNPVQTEKLYKTALKYAALTGKETVIDAYCGIGTLTLAAAASAEKVYGCEINHHAVVDAILNAKLNGTENVRFVCSDSGEFMEKFNEEGLKADTVIMDPARAGCDRKFLSELVKASPDRIVYVSCNPETQARDVFYLIKNGYKIKKLQPVDMFPFTSHVETVCLLSKLKSDQHIEVELKTDELDLTSAESKATYDEIKAYVKEHTGLTVSSLYIAQVKQKCGIIERENYNKAKSKDSRQPKCPKDKEEAIVGALKYFKIIS
ncbi:MAG: 23S rRNA (uracil(1939)-C(5))-methyltransferase RlmD [Huintestinicola sp.]